MTATSVGVDYWRQMDILSPRAAADTKITVIGAGGIGSPTIWALSKMGMGEIVIWDFDSVESHNLPNQMFLPEHIGQNKAEITAEYAEKMGTKATPRVERYMRQPLSDIVVVAVDNMATRKEAWEVCKLNPNVKLFIEARMGAEFAQIYAINPMSVAEIKFYEDTLFDDDEADELPCTARAIIFNVFGIAAFIGSFVSKYVMGRKFPYEIQIDFVNTRVFTIETI